MQVKQSQTRWWITGLVWGMTVLIITSLLQFRDFSWKHFFIGIPVWTVAGLLFGYITRHHKRRPQD